MIIRFLQLGFIVSLTFIMSCSSVTGIEEFGNFRSQVSDASLSQETKDLFNRNAAALAYREQAKKNSTFLYLSSDLIDFYYDIQVHIATSEAGKKQPITLDTRIFERTNLNELIAYPRISTPFLGNWKDSVITTSISEIDQLLEENKFFIKSIHYWFSDEQPTFILRRNDPINTLRLSELLEKTGYFNYVEINGYIGDGNNMIVELKEDFLEVTYTLAYGDCPSGCISEDFYTFRISTNGEVGYLGKNINS